MSCRPGRAEYVCPCSGHPKRRKAATSLNSLGVLALPYVGQRNDHQDALGAGLGVTEFAQEGKASEEVRELWRWVLKKLVEGSLDHEPRAKKAAC
jgi:chromosome partitioning protein